MNTRSALSLVLLLMIASVASAEDGSSDQRFLAGLRERGLFRLAETYCLKRLKRPDLPEPERADLVIELARVLAERAVSSPPEARPPFWQRASQVTEDFVRQYPQSPWLPLVRLQEALLLLSRGELARLEAQVGANRENLLQNARTHVRDAIRQLGKLAEEVELRLRERNLSGPDETARLSAHQLARLKKNIRYQLARALRNQAQCYAPDGPDWANSLTQAVKLLDPLAKLDPVDPLAWKSRIDLVVCHRLLADHATARRQLDALLQQKPPPAVELRARAESIHLALTAGRLPEAISVLSKGRQIEGTISAELDLAWLETYLTAWRAAGDANNNADAAAWQARATGMVERIEQEHGPYWTRRAGIRLAGYVRAAPLSGDLAMLVRAAESSFRSSQFDAALAAYDRAREVAAKQGKADRAFELGYIAATIEHKRDRHDRARDRYRRIAMALPNHPKASEAHLLAIYHAGRIVRKQPPDSLDAYAGLLGEHLRTWPHATNTDKVRRRLGRLREHQHKWKDAIDAYRAVSPDNAEYLQVVEALERCCRAWLGERKSGSEPANRIAADAAGAADWFESLVVGPRKLWPERWSPVQRAAALAAARLRLNYTTAGYDQTQTVLRAALQRAADAGRADQALAQYRSLAEANPREGAIAEAYAQLLLIWNDRVSLEKALAGWRELEKKSPPRSPRWFRAKYQVASLHYRLGNKEQAAKILKLLKLLHPELGGQEMKKKFEKLLESCRP